MREEKFSCFNDEGDKGFVLFSENDREEVIYYDNDREQLFYSEDENKKWRPRLIVSISILIIVVAIIAGYIGSSIGKSSAEVQTEFSDIPSKPCKPQFIGLYEGIRLFIPLYDNKDDCIKDPCILPSDEASDETASGSGLTKEIFFLISGQVKSITRVNQNFDPIDEISFSYSDDKDETISTFSMHISENIPTFDYRYFFKVTTLDDTSYYFGISYVHYNEQDNSGATPPESSPSSEIKLTGYYDGNTCNIPINKFDTRNSCIEEPYVLPYDGDGAKREVSFTFSERVKSITRVNRNFDAISEVPSFYLDDKAVTSFEYAMEVPENDPTRDFRYFFKVTTLDDTSYYFGIRYVHPDLL